MAASRRNCIARLPISRPSPPPSLVCNLPQNIPSCFRHRVVTARKFGLSARRLEQQQQHRKESFSSRLRSALAGTPIKWYPIPVGLGIGFLGFLQFTKIQRREEQGRDLRHEEEEDEEPTGKPKRRPRIRPSGPWSVQIMSTLPLKAMSRVWGKFNELTIPYYLRVPGFKLYGWIFGVK